MRQRISLHHLFNWAEISAQSRNPPATVLCARISILFAALLPLLVPFSAGRNIDQQGLVLLFAGGFAWLSLLLSRRQFWPSSQHATGLLIIIGISCAVCSFATPHFGYNFLGTPYIRLGSAGLLSCIGVGLLLRRVLTAHLAALLYCYGLLLAALSLAYSLIKFHNDGRFGGLFAQADIMACLLGCTLLLGWNFCGWQTIKQRLAILAQLALCLLLILTQTRAVLALVLLLSGIWVFRNQRSWRLKISLIVALGVLVVGALAQHIVSPRLADAHDAQFSAHYRIELDQAASHAIAQRPLLGYGPGNLADALDCRTLHAPDLQRTCNAGFYFNSSHNIYLDRALGYGIVAGLAYTAFVILALVCGWRQPSQHNGLVYAAALIAGYYLTNVTSLVVELLFWVLLLQCLSFKAATKNHA